MEFFVYLFVIVVVFMVLSQVLSSKKAKSTATDLLADHPNSSVHVSDSDQSFCVVDFDTSSLVLGSTQSRFVGGILEAAYPTTYSFADIAGVEVRQDDVTLISTNRGSQAIGATVGALAFGGVGAIVGGLSGSKTQKSLVEHVYLIVKVRDQSKPIHTITFLATPSGSKGWEAGSMIVKQAVAKAETFASHVANAIHASETGAEVKNAAPAPEVREDVMVSLKELMTMRKNGELTDQEFRAAKARLISGG